MNGSNYFQIIGCVTALLLSGPAIARDMTFPRQETAVRSKNTVASCSVPKGTKEIRRFAAKVLRVQDGDSVIVQQVGNNRKSTIRLAGIDAPELAQPWGPQAQRALARYLKDQSLTVHVTDRDRYGRLVGVLCTNGGYVNARLAAEGHAWAFDRYMKDDRIRSGQIAARKAKLGLWSLPEKDRIPPATWRQKNQRRSN